MHSKRSPLRWEHDLEVICPGDTSEMRCRNRFNGPQEDLFTQKAIPMPMSYCIPSRDILADAIRAVLKKRPMVGSQRKLTQMVLKELRGIGEGFTASEERIRRVAIDTGAAKIEIHCRESEEKSKYGRCPVCGSKMRRIRNETIFGGTVTLGHKCTRCPYWTGVKRRVPVRYVFYADGYTKNTEFEGAVRIDDQP